MTRSRRFAVLSGAGAAQQDVRPMKPTPRFLAAAWFSVIATFDVATWWTFLSPIHNGLEQLRFIFAPGYELRQFFVWFFASTLLTVTIASAYWFRWAAARPVALILLCASVFLLAISLRWFDTISSAEYALGLLCAAWATMKPNISLERDAPKAARPST